MEMTYEQWREARKEIKRRMSTTGWALLIYYAIMNVAVIGWMTVETLFGLFQGAISGDLASIESSVANSAESAWGYFLAAAVGFLILLLWKKPQSPRLSSRLRQEYAKSSSVRKKSLPRKKKKLKNN